MKPTFILKPLFIGALLCTATTLYAKEYQPRADALLAKIILTPQNAAEVTQMCEVRLATAQSMRSELEAMSLTADPKILFAAYDDLYNVLMNTAYTEASLVQQVNDDEKIRKAGADCQELGGKAITAMFQSRPLFERLKVVEAANSDPAMKWTLARQVDNFRRGGVDKSDEARAKIGALQDAITATSIEFDQNIAKDVRYFEVTPAELAGLPSDFTSQYKPNDKGKISLPLTGATLSPILKYAENSDLRKRILVEFDNRAYPTNEPVLARLIAQRSDFAKAMGYDNYAAYDYANRMAKNPATVKAFMDDIAAAARPIAEQEKTRMLARLQKDDPTLTQLNQWDTSRAGGLIRTEEYSVDPKIVRQYFRYDKVRDGIFKLTEDLFGVQIRPWNAPLWSNKAEAYEMVENDKVIGRFYLDMHPRDGKYTHAAMFPVRLGIKDREIPVAALVTNFPDGLMEHGQVETYLHEFGHLIHWLFAGQVNYATQNFSEIENDVIEAPSTMLEEWVWDYDTLKTFATNDKGEVIPEELVKKMNAGRAFGNAFGTMNGLGYTSVSYDFYTLPMAGKDLTEVENAATAKYSLMAPVPNTHSFASFGHLSGYAASYYTYEWSTALAKDLFSRFRSEGLRNTKVADAYRQQILAPGGTASMNDLALAFLGRDWSVDAYREELIRGTGE